MKTVEGIVVKVAGVPSKYGKGQKLYTAFLADENGNEHGVYYNFGTTQPPFEVGDKVRLGVEFKDAKRAQFVEGQGEILGKQVGVPSKDAPQSGGNQSGGGYTSRYNDPKTQQSIAYQSARKDAVQLLAIALQYEALPLGSGKGKRYDELKAQLRKLTAELYLDLQDIDAAVKAADVQPVQQPDPGSLPDQDEQPAANDDEIDVSSASVEQPQQQRASGKF